jgi:hypothetical protein
MSMSQRDRAALDRYITGNYGEDSVPREGVLSDECEALLADHDMYSEPSSLTPDLARIRDEDGRQLFMVSRSIAHADLKAVISYGRAQFNAGMMVGRGELQRQLRALLDVVPANPQESA